MAPIVEALYRYAVKGLDRDALETVALVPNRGLPKDREWALHFEEPPIANDPDVPLTRFHSQAPAWTHKSNFLCAYTAGELLATFETRYSDATDELTVCRRADGESLLVARLTDADERERVETFFSDASSRGVRLVRPADNRPHHFGNTNAGFRVGDAGGYVLHIVNLETIAALNKATGNTFEPSRFRPNIVISGVPAWAEFDWVGSTIRVGGATLEVLKRTVRCDAINVDGHEDLGNALRHLRSAQRPDVPGLLSKHFPEHGPYLGIYARVVEGGSVRVGDALQPPPSPMFSIDPRGWSMKAKAIAAITLATLLLPLLARRDRLLLPPYAWPAQGSN